MENHSIEAYREAIKAKYISGNTGPNILPVNPTPAELRNLCAILLIENTSLADQEILSVFFEFEPDRDKRRQIEGFKISKFRPVQSFFNNEKQTKREKVLNLAALLIDFEPRPYRKFRKQSSLYHPSKPLIQSNTPISSDAKTDWKTLEDEADDEGAEIVKDPAGIVNNKGSNVPGPLKNRGKKISWKVNKVLFFLTGLLMFLIGGYAMLGSFSINDCVQWTGDHYEKVVCEGKKNGFAHINPIYDYNEALIDFRKIKVNKSTVFFKDGQPIIWYIKQNNTCEFFNGPGLHPVSGKSLLPVSRYIIAKYVDDK